MTPFSFEKLTEFLNKYTTQFPKNPHIADYGGAMFDQQVRDLLANGGFTDYNVLDYETGFDLNKPLKGKKYDLGICMDLLEHCNKPWLVAKTIIDSLIPGAYLFVTAPFIWELHGFPGDYFRFTSDGLISLFEGLEYVEGALHRDIQLKKVNGQNVEIQFGASMEPDSELPRSRVVMVFRKPLKKKKK